MKTVRETREGVRVVAIVRASHWFTSGQLLDVYRNFYVVAEWHDYGGTLEGMMTHGIMRELPDAVLIYDLKRGKKVTRVVRHLPRYYVDNHATWFVVEARSKRAAHSVGSQEFGRGQVRCVRRATEMEVKHFTELKGESALRAD